MGIAAYNRGNKAISEQFKRELPCSEALVLDKLNGFSKFEDARTPFGDIHFVAGHGGWWAECPTTGRGFWYKTLSEAVRRWNVAIVSVGMLKGELVYIGRVK